ncbi:uncharacterized protein EI90DRAFT_2465460 [Cantharellus anzutake]|uniref:uncharacterized protein n=1 Tax=Cantharellus anzutake TaxID=1750568 RepID=UPI0019052190|nr:uncharacterized protein EI90DRAFT_2465460 [Cantharellus anzutake]KAF8339149.1 hypothetical protein EI90DRAFT_2465460 [Cantharellus anzutake]
MRTRHTLHTLPTFPVWSAGFISDTRLVLGGGGGTGRTGVKNKLRLYDVQDGGEKIELLNESLMEKDEDAPMTLAVNPQDGSLVCGVNASSESIEKGVNEHCRLYRMKGNELSLENQKQFISTNDVEVYQTLLRFHRIVRWWLLGRRIMWCPSHRILLLLLLPLLFKYRRASFMPWTSLTTPYLLRLILPSICTTPTGEWQGESRRD